MKGRGFSVVELMIVIVVIGLLLGVGMLGFSRLQVNARDTERKTKAENIARYLESMYSHGHPSPFVEAGTYPRVSALANSCTNSACTANSSANPWPISQTKLENLFSSDSFDLKNLVAPGQEDYSVVVTKSAADNPSEVGVSTFVYQPLASLGSGYGICNLNAHECRAFNLYYQLEADQVIYKITSKHR